MIFFSLTYRDPSSVMTSRSFQRTFPLRKSTGSCSRKTASTSTTTATAPSASAATQGSQSIYNDASDNESKCEQQMVKINGNPNLTVNNLILVYFTLTN
jgi:hypothetical protein